MPFEMSAQQRYFELHPVRPRAVCSDCRKGTCQRPIPASLSQAHERMYRLYQRGLAGATPKPMAAEQASMTHMVLWECDASNNPARTHHCRLAVENVGTYVWHLAEPNPQVELEVRAGGSILETVRMRGDVCPGQRCYFVFKTPCIRQIPRKMDCKLVFRQGNHTIQRVTLGTVEIGAEVQSGWIKPQGAKRTARTACLTL
ncbi:MAG: hypothetical protein ABSH28_10470 [Acidobacteriota bacterium]|jgi:hypothetical protein